MGGRHPSNLLNFTTNFALYMLDTVSKPAVFHKYPSLKIISENIGLGSEELSLLTLSKMKEV